MCTPEAVSMFDALLNDISSQTTRQHKRLKFVNRNLLEPELVERKLQMYFSLHLTEAQQKQLSDSLEGIEGEARVCECLMELIRHGEERVDKHVELFKAVVEMMHEVRGIKDEDELLAEVVIKCSLMVHDSFALLCAVKRIIASVCAIYQVPYYYDAKDSTIRLRSSLLSTFKNLNIIIDDLQTLGETLWIVRNYDAIEP